MDGFVAGPLKQTKRDAPKVAERDTMKDVKHGPMQASKRKPEDELVNETTKKPKTGPSTIPPVRKPGGFMQSIQLPGFSAAPATVSVVAPAPQCSAS